MSLVHQRRLRVHVESVNKKGKMETATGVTWTKTECERECWAIIKDDRPFHSDSFHWHANVQSKAVFSFAMTVMDKIHGWIDEEKWVGSKFFCVHVDLHQDGEMGKNSLKNWRNA